ncbi:probable tubulin polyglutamylase ttll-15 [Anopheles ziemanni]|uniref:probable tubulin polyglutamylase ttll-15 n=1 Tax=Anopheles coustani TaxID=139045 RepID=UPI0026584D0D|nr:probable tubulin polyglutamylase ttll-15 [Anopheles coustani]XP_058169664.1 probable tubulin polyglutamylase ttll-15 [Anopheles ziemanni]
MPDKRKEDNNKKPDERAKSGEKVRPVPNADKQPTHTDDGGSFFDLRTKSGQILFMAVTITAVTLVQCLPKESLKSFLRLEFPAQPCKPNVRIVEKEVFSNEPRPKYWIYGRNPTGGHLLHVHNVLQRLGIEQTTNDSNEWDLLWAHDYPFRQINLQRMKPHQLVNHFPGSGYITNKVDLSTTRLPYIPAAFKLPAGASLFREYATANPGKKFVQKNNQHRHIQIKETEEIDFNSNDTFIQEFIDDPLLVDGYKFDIGVYTVITSIDPLRVYIYKGDVLFRYCPVPYYPFNASNVDKYIVGDDYLPTWEVPSLKQYYEKFGFGMKDSFDAYVRSTGQEPDVIWQQVEDAIRTLILKKEPLLAALLPRYANRKNFFEMMRFDLVVDKQLKVFLMEANMSPNLSSAHFKPNRLLYEQVIYNLFQLVGVGSSIRRDSFRKRAVETEAMVSSVKNIAVNANQCSELPCMESCAPVECQLCTTCLEENRVADIHRAYREHMNRGDMKRIFPVPKADQHKLDYDSLTASNQLMSRWFEEKCKVDHSYC